MATALALGAVGVLPGAAVAAQRTITVRLPGGKTITVPVDVPDGSILDKLTLPDVNTPVLGVSESKPGAKPSGGGDGQSAAPGAQAKPAQRKPAARPKPKTVVVKARHAKPRRASKAKSVGPTAADPTFSYALPGPAPIGVPNFFIDRFRIPPFLLSIYQAAGAQYGIRWEVLAAINEIETDYGRNLAVSTAGAEGWMQFMPATWKRYGVDANADGTKDPYNPVDAIFAAARYLKAAGADQDVRKAIYAYNHADWYVDSVLMRARLIGGLPADLVGSLTGLTEGRFPVAATSRYVRGSSHALNIYSHAGAAVIAVQDATVTRVGRHWVQIRDAYGNTYTYGALKRVARTYKIPAARSSRHAAIDLPAKDPSPAMAASAGKQAVARITHAVLPHKQRLFAHPRLVAGVADAGTEVKAGRHARKAALRKGSHVVAGTVLGRLGSTSSSAAHVHFSIRPAGKHAPRIDPKPILDGWKLLESTAIYRAAGRNPLFGPDAKAPSIGQALLMSKAQLIHRVLTDPNITIYEAGRQDIKAGVIDRRVLATLEFLSASGLKPTVSCLRSGHSYLTTSGNVSEHSSGNAVDISAINGIPILGHQGPGSITDITIRRLLTLQGTTQPHQIISLMTYAGQDTTLALPDHADHIHVGFRPQAQTVLKPLQWDRLLDRISHIDNPTIAEPGADR